MTIQAGFQHNAFQFNAFQMIESVVSNTFRITKPVNCVLIGDQPMAESGKTAELFNLDLRNKTKILTSNVQRLSKDVSTFTVTSRKLRQ